MVRKAGSNGNGWTGDPRHLNITISHANKGDRGVDRPANDTCVQGMYVTCLLPVCVWSECRATRLSVAKNAKLCRSCCKADRSTRERTKQSKQHKTKHDTTQKHDTKTPTSRGGAQSVSYRTHATSPPLHSRLDRIYCTVYIYGI